MLKTYRTRCYSSAVIKPLLLFAVLSVTGICQATEQILARTQHEKVFARIDDLTISYGEFLDIFRAAVRHKYYHGRVPEEELQKFQKQVAKDIVEQILVHREALKQGLKPNSEKIRQGLDEYDKKYASSPDWQKQKEQLMPQLLKRMERQDLIEQMETRIKNIKKPGMLQVKNYYQQNPQKFTEPARLWISVLLLSVPPSAEMKMWSDAEIAARQFKQQIIDGESFADIARRYSGHPSAVNGGDLGYLHQGMLEADAQTAIEKLQVNQISEPVRVLEGVALFRLNGVQAEKPRAFDEVKQRAASLLFRELQDQAWDNYTRKLTASANVYLNEELYVHNDEK